MKKLEVLDLSCTFPRRVAHRARFSHPDDSDEDDDSDSSSESESDSAADADAAGGSGAGAGARGDASKYRVDHATNGALVARRTLLSFEPSVRNDP